MTPKQLKVYLIDILKGRRDLIDVWHYLIGNYRYKLFYSKGAKQSKTIKHPLMRKHIWEQIKFRIRVMNADCYYQGSCVKCGCETTKLQMAAKSCDGDCYPSMMDATNWTKWKSKEAIIDYTKGGIWLYSEAQGVYTFHKETPNSFIPTDIKVKL